MPLIIPQTDSLPYIDRPPSPSALARAEDLIRRELRLLKAQEQPPTTSQSSSQLESQNATSEPEPLHSSLPPLPEATFTPLMTELLSRVTLPPPTTQAESTSTSTSNPSDPTSSKQLKAKPKPKPRIHRTQGEGIDLSRYEALPSNTPTSSNPSASTTITNPQNQNPKLQPLLHAQTNQTYLHTRHANLTLLETEPGKNSWLIGNAQLEEMLRDVERDLVATRTEVENVNRGRKEFQMSGGGQGGAGAGGGGEELEVLERQWKEGVGRVLETGVAVGALGP